MATPNLGIKTLATQQEQPNVIFNEMAFKVELALNGAISFGLNTPPVSPSVGDIYVIGDTPTGAWANRGECVTIWTEGGWRFLPENDSDGTPIVMGAGQHGLRVYNRDDDSLYVWDGSSWEVLIVLGA